jgi:hypothetical protein
MKYVAFFIAFMLITSASALLIDDTRVDSISPGESGSIIISLENDGSSDLEDVSVSLDLTNLPFSTVGTSSVTLDKIEEDESEDFYFEIRANSDAEIKDYNIPYIIEYEDKERKGTIGIRVIAVSNLDFTSSLDNPIEDEKSELTLRIINKGLGEVKFVTVRIYPEGYTLLSEDLVYIGNIDSDDFEDANFNIIINDRTPDLIATIEYQDIDNKKYEENVIIPLTIYSQEKAIQLGLKTKNNTPTIIISLVILVILFFVYRSIRKRLRKKRNNVSRE